MGASDLNADNLNTDRLQHEPQYRRKIIEEIVTALMEEAEKRDFDVTFQKLRSEIPEILDQISDHVERKIESIFEGRLTKKRIQKGLIYSGNGSNSHAKV